MASKCGGDTMHEQVHDRQKDDLTATLAQATLSLHVRGVVVTMLLRVVSCAFCSDLCSTAASLLTWLVSRLHLASDTRGLDLCAINRAGVCAAGRPSPGQPLFF